MTILDIAIIFFVLLGAFIGYKQGAITSILNMVGTLLIFIISFYLKGPVSMILFEAFPAITLIVAAVDSHLNERGYIVPGMGDAGDRIFNT